MNNSTVSASLEANESYLVFETSQGFETRSTILRLSRHAVVFEVYAPAVLLHLSEVLPRLQITLGNRVVFSGRAVISNVLNSGVATVCEATLEDAWHDLNYDAPDLFRRQIQADFQLFWETAQKSFAVSASFKLAVADIQFYLMELRRW